MEAAARLSLWTNPEYIRERLSLNPSSQDVYKMLQSLPNLKNPFLHNVQTNSKKYGTLTEKQAAAVAKTLAKDYAEVLAALAGCNIKAKQAQEMPVKGPTMPQDAQKPAPPPNHTPDDNEGLKKARKTRKHKKTKKGCGWTPALLASEAAFLRLVETWQPNLT